MFFHLLELLFVRAMPGPILLSVLPSCSILLLSSPYSLTIELQVSR